MAEPTGSTSDGGDWATRLTAQVEALVEFVRDKSVRPILTVSKGLVVGVLGLFLLAVLVVTGVVGLGRLFDNDVFAGRVWATDLLIGGIFATLGVFCWFLGIRGRRSDGE